MPEIEFKIEYLFIAFRKLKRLIYYDKANLQLRRRLADFENNQNFPTRMEILLDVLNSKTPSKHDSFMSWINNIDYYIVNKKLEDKVKANLNDGTFISNLNTASQYKIEKVNYFFDGPIELQLIAVVWLMSEGHFLDKILGPECYGARLEKNVGKPDDDSADLYCRYHELYKKWRDQGIRKAKNMLTEDKESVCILGLDVQEYYYHASLDYNEIYNELHSKKNEDIIHSNNDFNFSGLKPGKILNLINLISKEFKLKISDSFFETHPHVPKDCIGIPIGLVSSPLLADWYLRKFDIAIKEEIRPAYYGRYVDDIFIVTIAPREMDSKSPVDSFIRQLLIKPGVIRDNGSEIYEITSRPGLLLQKSKCILQHFDVDHSIAGLDKFQKKLESNASDFLLMPVDEDESSLEEVAYEILYDGSVNKFRSVKGISENRYELAKHLSRQTMLHLLTDDPPDKESSENLISFFKGKNAIEFNDIWEKVFTFFYVSGDISNFLKFKNALIVEISRLAHSNGGIAHSVKDSLGNHLDLSMDMALSLGPAPYDSNGARAFRKSNLLRHHFVRVPLTNYTRYSGSLISKYVPVGIHLSKNALLNSPRFVNFDECMLFLNNGKYYKRRNNDFNIRKKLNAASRIFLEINRSQFKGATWLPEEKQDEIEND
jgi:hypothetical protein